MQLSLISTLNVQNQLMILTMALLQGFAELAACLVLECLSAADDTELAVDEVDFSFEVAP